MKVSVVVPWTPGCRWRERAWAHVHRLYANTCPSWEIITGRTPAGPYSRTQGILDAAERASGDVLVVGDADVWCDPRLAVLHAAEHGWAIPHTLIHRLSPESTEQVYDGADWRGLPLSTDNAQDRRPYKGKETGTLVVLRRDVLTACPPDRRFVGWGSEDIAWGLALNTLHGAPWRGTDDLVHLWHPPQPRKSRTVGTDENAALLRRYQRARRNPAAMAELIEEARCVSVHQSSVA